ncbi:MAG: hypothetical protein C0411_12595 [Pseudomonas sp.]|nr:hypothetical protein [Pseudomonas sp.]
MGSINQAQRRIVTITVTIHTDPIVPTLCVGMPQGTLRVPAPEWDAERPGLHSHAERGNDHQSQKRTDQSLFGNLQPSPA